ncbi:MAG: NADH-quinone oxidoreductase subunit NuoN [Burkholderiales bacterium]|nr:MAG: NADH-quinone oxidoreductase subunit NuoN [Betaproteobacteria bacterium]TAG80107.1 MAG: NADH-quinone oxidoreductase subunit NuoN [Burkholderiales bacterium]
MKDLTLVSPEIVLLTLACLILVVDLFVRRDQKLYTFTCGIAALLWTAAYVYAVGTPIGSAPQYAFSNLVVVDGVATVLKLSILLSAAAAMGYSWRYLKKHDLANGEYVTLVLLGTLGMLVMASAANMLTAYLGLELMSLSMYALVALKRDDKIATEAAMKYFVLGALASGLLLFGMSIIYGATGSLDLDAIGAALAKGNRTAIAFGLVFIAAGVAFKLGVVPFHMWVPDVYNGAPTAVTLFLGTAPKVAAFALAYRLFNDGLAAAITDWSIILAVIATLSVVLGNLIAIAQTNIKRMLAYSAIANMGFLLLGVVAGGKEGFSAALFYAVVYTITGLVSLGILVLLSARGVEFENIDDLKGLNSRSPWLAFLMLLAMFSLAGIPPTLGFWAKLTVIEAVVNANYVWLAVIAVLASLVGAFYYLRVVKVMYFADADEGKLAMPSRGEMVLLSANALAILVLGALPSALLAICVKAVQAS